MLDKNWFYCHIVHESIWLSGAEKAPETERWMIAPPKLMLTVVWSRARFHVVDVLPKGVKFCSAYSRSHTMDLLMAALQPDQQHPFPTLIVHADKSRVDRSMIIDEYFQSRRLWHLQISFCFVSLRDS
jgi:hypothetical protein